MNPVSYTCQSDSIQLVYSLHQYYLMTPDNLFGFATHNNRPYAIFQQPNVAASFFVTGIVLSLYLLVKEQHKFKQGLCLLVVFCAVIPVILLQSRTGYLSIVIAPLMVLPWAYLTAREEKTTKWLLGWFGLYAVGVALGTLTLQLADSVARDAAALTNPGARVPIYLHSLNMFLQQPWLGWGLGSFEVNFLHSYADALAQGQAMPGAAANLDHPHNELLFWAIEGGIITILGIAMLAIGFIYLLLKHHSRLKSLALVGMLFPILLHTQTEYPFYHSAVHWVVFLTLVWLACGDINKVSQPFMASFLLKCMTILLTIGTIAYMLTSLHTNHLMVRYQRSDPKDLTPLTEVINPVSHLTRFNYSVNMFRLKTAFHKNDHAEMERYLTWAETVNATTPRATLYVNCINALWQLGKHQQAKHMFVLANKLYPNNKQLQSLKLGQSNPEIKPLPED